MREIGVFFFSKVNIEKGRLWSILHLVPGPVQEFDEDGARGGVHRDGRDRRRLAHRRLVVLLERPRRKPRRKRALAHLGVAWCVFPIVSGSVFYYFF